ncbi:hypothetical protein KCU77_g13146, partial [Aureobasidium melanogenum]
MCQLCVFNTISQSSRWPKPLEPLISDLPLLVNTTNSEFNSIKPSTAEDTSDKLHLIPSTTSTTITIIKTATNSTATTRTSLLTTLRDIKTLLELLDEERIKWWNAKAKERKYWRETYQQDKITKINVVNKGVES